VISPMPSGSCRRLARRFSCCEVDTGSGRAGVDPASGLLLEVARAITDGGSELVGVLTHAGHSYAAKGTAKLRAVAEQERSGVPRPNGCGPGGRRAWPAASG
jgi:D-serine deaminase-like pyridoxal phosphate-dependent protein